MGNAVDAWIDKVDWSQAGIRAIVACLFRAIKQQFRYLKARYRRLKKNTAQLPSGLRCRTYGWCAAS
jgi:IS5 family transposase